MTDLVASIARSSSASPAPTPPPPSSIISSIARITIGGIAQGNGDNNAHFGITAQYIGKATVAGLKIPLVKTAIDSFPLGGTGNFLLVEVSA